MALCMAAHGGGAIWQSQPNDAVLGHGTLVREVSGEQESR